MNDGWPAFPRPTTEFNTGQEGMSLRDYFAGQALAGLVKLTLENKQIPKELMATVCWEIADELIKARGIS